MSLSMYEFLFTNILAVFKAIRHLAQHVPGKGGGAGGTGLSSGKIAYAKWVAGILALGLAAQAGSCNWREDHEKAAVDALLLKACHNANFELAQLLVKDGADVHAADMEGKTALMLAASSPRAMNYGLINFLIEKGADVNARDKSGRTALMMAFEKDYMSAVWLLTTKGADPNVTNEKGESPLIGWMGRMEPNGGIANAFLDRGNNVNLKAKDGTTALIALAANTKIFKPSVGAMTILIQKGADAKARDDSGRTALMYAAENGSAEMVRLLLVKNVDVDAVDNNGKTALLLALERGHIDVAEILVQSGANLDIRDKAGVSPLKQADLTMGKFRQFLLQKGAKE